MLVTASSAWRQQGRRRGCAHACWDCLICARLCPVTDGDTRRLATRKARVGGQGAWGASMQASGHDGNGAVGAGSHEASLPDHLGRDGLVSSAQTACLRAKAGCTAASLPASSSASQLGLLPQDCFQSGRHCWSCCSGSPPGSHKPEGWPPRSCRPRLLWQIATPAAVCSAPRSRPCSAVGSGFRAGVQLGRQLPKLEHVLRPGHAA